MPGVGTPEPQPQSGPAWTVRGLKERCRFLRESIRVRKIATDEEVKAYWPGGEENPNAGLGGWIYCYANLVRFMGRTDASALAGAVARGDADRAVLDALRAEPVPVALVEAPDGAPAPVLVYPKSLDAHLHIHALDRQLAFLAGRYAVLDAMTKEPGRAVPPQIPALLARIAAVMSYTTALLVWIVTTPGPAMPYGADEPDPEPPAWIVALAPLDVIRVIRAHQTHQIRLAAVNALIDERAQSDGGQRPSWSMFIGSLAQDLGEPAPTLMRHRSLGELLAAARLNAAAKMPPPREEHGGSGGGGTRPAAA